MSRGELSGRVSVAAVKGNVSRLGQNPLVRVRVEGDSRKVAPAATALAREVVKRVSGYADAKIAVLEDAIEQGDAELARLDEQLDSAPADASAGFLVLRRGELFDQLVTRSRTSRSRKRSSGSRRRGSRRAQGDRAEPPQPGRRGRVPRPAARARCCAALGVGAGASPPLTHMRRALIWAVALASTIGFGYLAIRDAHPDEVWDALQEANIWWVVPSFAVLAVAVAIRALRWQLLFQRETRPPYGATAASTIVGLAVNSLLPLRAGEAARVIALNRRCRHVARRIRRDGRARAHSRRLLPPAAPARGASVAPGGRLGRRGRGDRAGACADARRCGAPVRRLRRSAVPRARPAAPAIAVRAPRWVEQWASLRARARRAAGPEARTDGVRAHHRGLAPYERVVLAADPRASTSSCRSSRAC